MGIKCLNGPFSCFNEPPKEFICDTEADIENLPKAPAGSTAMIVESGKLYMVNASGEWKPFGEA